MLSWIMSDASVFPSSDIRRECDRLNAPPHCLHVVRRQRNEGVSSSAFFIGYYFPDLSMLAGFDGDAGVSRAGAALYKGTTNDLLRARGPSV
jgi:hypothetical protein